MNPCCLLVLLSPVADPSTSSATSPALSLAPPAREAAPLGEFDAFGSLEAEVAAAIAAGSAPQQRVSRRGGIVAPQRPSFFISAGYHGVEAERFFDDESDDEAVSLDIGYMTWSGEMGFALEAGVMRSSFETQLNIFERDDVDTTRYLLGLRFIDSKQGSSFAPYLRGGFMYREDEGDLIDDSGSGWYVGGGIDLKFGGSGFSIAPQLLYAESDSLNTTEWLFGLTATLAF